MKKMHTLSLGLFLCLLTFQNQSIAQIPNLVISEIMYNPPETGADSLEYIEIYNNGNSDVDLNGILFTEGINHVFSNQTLAANSYLVLAKDSIAFQNVFGTIAYEWDGGTLGNSGEVLEIQTSNGELIDVVEYSNIATWPLAANGLGASLVLCDLDADNFLPENWMESTTATDIIINNIEIIANPNTPSQCPIGPIISFMGNSINVIEDNITIYIQIVIEDGNANSTEVIFDLDFFSVGTLGEDFLMDENPPLTIVFPGGLAKDTQTVSIHVTEDFDIESSEIVTFQLGNPTNDAIINPMHDSFEILIEDDDAILPDLVISEIMYNPPEEGVDSTEFIELYNNDTVTVNLEGYYFSEGIEFVFPEVLIHPSEYIVIARDSNAFISYYGFSTLQWTSGSLKNSGELIELRNFGGNVAASVEYDNTANWSLAADGEGPSLVLCNANLNNNNPANWNESISSTGIFVDSVEVFADPAMENNCLIPLSPYPLQSIGQVTTVNSEGELDSLGLSCELSGIVHGVNLNASNGGLQFALIDDNGDGITVYHASGNFGYSVEEGDEVIVQGVITQLNGLAKIEPDSLWMTSSNNTLSDAQEVTMLNENVESELVEIKNLTIINPNAWNNSTPDGFNVLVTNGTDTFDLRIDDDVELYQMDVPDFLFNLKGLGGQHDTETPFTDGYQILPRYALDIMMVTALENLEEKEVVKIYPNPIDEFFTIELLGKIDFIQVENILGQNMLSILNPNKVEKILCEKWDSGLYMIHLFYGKKIRTIKLIK